MRKISFGLNCTWQMEERMARLINCLTIYWKVFIWINSTPKICFLYRKCCSQWKSDQSWLIKEIDLNFKLIQSLEFNWYVINNSQRSINKGYFGMPSNPFFLKEIRIIIMSKLCKYIHTICLQSLYNFIGKHTKVICFLSGTKREKQSS